MLIVSFHEFPSAELPFMYVAFPYVCAVSFQLLPVLAL
ncbi:protein of unknown function [Paraburkholderia kururiensis]